MPSEWAKSKALESPVFKEAAHRSATSDADFESFMCDFAEALDAARAQGRREGLEEAAKIALTEATQLDGLNERMAKGADRVAIAIRALIAQEPHHMKAKSITQVDLTMSGEEADLLIEFILKFARQRPVKESDQLLRIAQELNAVRRLMPKNVIDAEFA